MASLKLSTMPAQLSFLWTRPMATARSAPAAPPSVGVTTPE